MPSNESSVKLVTQIKEQIAEMETQLNGHQISEAVLKHINAMLGDVLEHTEAAVALACGTQYFDPERIVTAVTRLIEQVRSETPANQDIAGSALEDNLSALQSKQNL